MASWGGQPRCMGSVGPGMRRLREAWQALLCLWGVCTPPASARAGRVRSPCQRPCRACALTPPCARAVCAGARVLRQDPVECLFQVSAPTGSSQTSRCAAACGSLARTVHTRAHLPWRAASAGLGCTCGTTPAPRSPSLLLPLITCLASMPCVVHVWLPANTGPFNNQHLPHPRSSSAPPTTTSHVSKAWWIA